MKWFILPAAAAFSLAVATPVFAAPDANAGQQSAQPAQTAIQLAQRHDRDRDRRRYDRRDRRDRFDHRRYDWRDYRPGQRPREWDRYRRRFDPRHWQRNFDAPRRYHWEPYRHPRGWYYRRWTFGTILPFAFWTRDYWIDSYWDFGLLDPPYGYVWVRYGPDAILVNVHTGVILRAVYGVFY